jgi:hypothetical protein
MGTQPWLKRGGVLVWSNGLLFVPALAVFIVRGTVQQSATGGPLHISPAVSACHKSDLLLPQNLI